MRIAIYTHLFICCCCCCLFFMVSLATLAITPDNYTFFFSFSYTCIMWSLRVVNARVLCRPQWFFYIPLRDGQADWAGTQFFHMVSHTMVELPSYVHTLTIANLVCPDPGSNSQPQKGHALVHTCQSAHRANQLSYRGSNPIQSKVLKWSEVS